MNKVGVKRIFRLFLPVFIFCASVSTAYAAIPLPKPNKHFTLTMHDMAPIFVAVFQHLMALFPVILMLFACYTVVRVSVSFFRKVMM